MSDNAWLRLDSATLRIQVHAINEALRKILGTLVVMSRHRKLNVADAAEQFAAAVVRLVDRTPRILDRRQLIKAAQSVNANIAEGFGRATTPDRNNRLVTARGEAEETIRHLRLNLAVKRITPADYWPLHNRAVAIVKMLNSLMA